MASSYLVRKCIVLLTEMEKSEENATLAGQQWRTWKISGRM